MSVYMEWCLFAGLGFLAKVCFSNLSTLVSHTATFATLAEIRLKLADKLTRVPMGYMINTPSGELKNVLVDRVEGMETTLAHLVPELTANLCIPICILIYLLFLDWRMALAALITLPIGMLCYKGMANGYEEKFQGLIMRVRKMTNTVVEYIGGIEVIKAFNQSANSYQKYSDAVEDNASYAVNWMKSVQLYKSMLVTIWPSVLVCVLPIGCIFVSERNSECSGICYLYRAVIGYYHTNFKCYELYGQHFSNEISGWRIMRCTGRKGTGTPRKTCPYSVFQYFVRKCQLFI